MKEWIPTMIATGALGAFWLLIRWNITELKKTIAEELHKLTNDISRIRDEYVPKDMHTLICGKSSLEIERLFKACMNQMKDEIFEHLRKFEDKINNK
jgi:hypothetical protein